MSNSKLVTHVNISPNRNSPRNHKIDTITIHHVAGNLTIETLGKVFEPTARRASSTYGVGSDGRVGMYCEEKDRPWTSSSRDNDNRAITIEVSNISGAPDWKVSDKALATLIDLCVDICQRNDIKKLLWQNNKSLIGQVDKQNKTLHEWFANTNCPGPYLKSKMGYIADEVNKRLGGNIMVISKDINRDHPIVKHVQEAIIFIDNPKAVIVGGAQGVIGSTTDVAIRETQRSMGQAPTGVIDYAFLGGLLTLVRNKQTSTNTIPRYIYEQKVSQLDKATKEINDLQNKLQNAETTAANRLTQINKLNADAKILTEKFNAEVKENTSLEGEVAAVQTNFKNLKVMYNATTESITNLSFEYTALEQKLSETEHKIESLQSEVLAKDTEIAQLKELEVAADIIDWKDAKPTDLIVHAIRVILKIEV